MIFTYININISIERKKNQIKQQHASKRIDYINTSKKTKRSKAIHAFYGFVHIDSASPRVLTNHNNMSLSTFFWT